MDIVLEIQTLQIKLVIPLTTEPIGFIDNSC